MKNRRSIAAAVVLLVLAGISCSGDGNFRVVKAVKDSFHIKVHANGQLRSAASIRIGCPVIRRVWQYTISFMAPEGKEVKKGQLILSFDARSMREKLQLKQSELDTAKKELERTRLVEQEKADTLVLQLAESKVKKEKANQKAQQPEELVAMNEVKKLRMDLEMAVLQEQLTGSRVKNQKVGMNTRINALVSKVKSLENHVANLKTAMQKMNVKAPKPGMVVYSTDWRGNKKAVGDNCWMGSRILELPDLTRMEVAAVIPEPQAGKVKVGLEAEVRLDSNPDKMYKGKIKSLGRIFRTKSRNQPAMVFDAVIEVKDPDPELMRPGMAATVDIIVSSKENVLQIPESAVIYHEKGLFVLKKTFTGKKRTAVTLGARSSGMVEVLSGLEENDRVVIRSGKNGES